MNAFEFGFFDELEKIAAYELQGVRPEVARAIKARLKALHTFDLEPLKSNLDHRVVEQRPDPANPHDVKFKKKDLDAIRVHQNPASDRIISYDMRRPYEAGEVGQIRAAVAKRKGELLEKAIRQYRSDKDLDDPHWYKKTHLPGHGPESSTYQDVLPNNTGGMQHNPWGRKIPQPSPRPPMPKPVRP